MLHAIVCEVNYATRSGEIVVKKLLCDTNTPKGKTCALKSSDKDPNPHNLLFRTMMRNIEMRIWN